MKCPKCGHQQPTSDECSACGVIIAKVLAHQRGETPAAPVRTQLERRGKTHRYGKLAIDRELRRYYGSQATMLGSGLSATAAHEHFVRETEAVVDLRPFKRISARLEAGDTISAGMHESPAYFPPHHCRLVEAGELAGNPASLFERLQQLVDRKIRIIEGIDAEMRKPKITFVASFLLLPLPTLFSSGPLSYLGGSLLPLLLLVLGWWGTKRVWQWLGTRPDAAMAIDERLLGNSLYRQYHTNQFLQVLNALYAGGMNLADGFEVAAGVSSNSFLRRVLASHQPMLANGMPLAETLRETGAFSADQLQVVTTGEAAGSLESALNRYLDIADDEFDRRLKRLAANLAMAMGTMILIYVALRIIGSWMALLPPPVSLS